MRTFMIILAVVMVIGVFKGYSLRVQSLSQGQSSLVTAQDILNTL